MLSKMLIKWPQVVFQFSCFLSEMMSSIFIVQVLLVHLEVAQGLDTEHSPRYPYSYRYNVADPQTLNNFEVRRGFVCQWTWSYKKHETLKNNCDFKKNIFHSIRKYVKQLVKRLSTLNSLNWVREYIILE